MVSTASGPESSALRSPHPLVSVGVPVYNGAEHLAEALESVLGQDYPNFEIIVSDNASEDATETIGRRYAEADPRVRYLRNSTNAGFLPNFRRALEEARGTYFTWLAHDDLLHDPSYIRTLVEYLELHPDIVVCTTAFRLLDFELSASEEIKELPELHPERWPRSRCALFRWPHGWVDLTIYGMFRRVELERIPIVERFYKGKPHIFWWETELLTKLSAVGRIVALPLCLRSYRRSTVSVGQRVVSAVSTFDLLLLGTKIKLILIGRAWRLPVGLRERLPLLATTFANLFRANLRQPYDHRAEIRRHERELEMLERVATQRSHLIESLKTELLRRTQLAHERGLEVTRADIKAADHSDAASGVDDSMNRGLPKRPARSYLADFFRPPLSSQAEYFRELNERIRQYRDICEQHLQTIEELDSEAAALLQRIQSPDSAPTTGRQASGQRMPLVSIGLPVYNGADRLAHAIDSVLAQDYPNIELILCDNASEDETPSICRRYAEADPRVKYFRNSTNIGFLPNFCRVLNEAGGTYFSWLAHDDLLSDPAYLKTVVGYLELLPDVVACSTAFFLLDNELPGSVNVLEFPELHPDNWPSSRRALFRWPRDWLDASIYGVFRREALAEVKIPNRSYRGRPHIFCWEGDVLTALSGKGRVVALPECLRSYRLSTVSVGQRIGETVSSFDLLLLGLELKLFLLRRALTLPIRWRERLGVVATGLANLFRANFRQPYDQRVVLRSRRRELSMLLGVAEERSQLIDSLHGEVARLQKAAAAKEVELGTPLDLPDARPDPGASYLAENPNISQRLIPKATRRGLLLDFFRPLSDSELQQFHELNQHIGRLRIRCQEQLNLIEQLHGEATAWKRIIESVGSTDEEGSIKAKS